MMEIQEKEIYYDKRTHRTYVSVIVGSEYAYLRYADLDSLKMHAGMIHPVFGTTRKDIMVIKDLKRLRPVEPNGGIKCEIPIVRIGLLNEGVRPFFEHGALEEIDRLRRAANWQGEPDECNDCVPQKEWVIPTPKAVTKRSPAAKAKVVNKAVKRKR